MGNMTECSAAVKINTAVAHWWRCCSQDYRVYTALCKTMDWTLKTWIECLWCFILELFIQNYLKLRINYDFKLTLWEFNKNKMSELRPGRLSFSWLWNEFSCNAAPIATASRTLYYRLGKHSSSNGVQCPCAIYSEPSYYIAVQSISNTRDICDSSRRCA